jgi:mono/diheme cytochrome c family protein
MKRSIAIACTVCIAVAAIFGLRQSGAQQSQSGPTRPYTPSLGDLMGGTQLRHFKLSYAGQVGNWPLAKYELAQIQENFSLAAELYPTFKNLPFAQLIKDESEPPLTEVGKAIDAKDAANFQKAFRVLTDACNHCHQAAGVGFITITVPTRSPFSNQSFTPSQK